MMRGGEQGKNNPVNFEKSKKNIFVFSNLDPFFVFVNYSPIIIQSESSVSISA